MSEDELNAKSKERDIVKVKNYGALVTDSKN
jgi:hypothetical protein